MDSYCFEPVGAAFHVVKITDDGMRIFISEHSTEADAKTRLMHLLTHLNRIDRFEWLQRRQTSR
jgi:hypothetical protein